MSFDRPAPQPTWHGQTAACGLPARPAVSGGQPSQVRVARRSRLEIGLAGLKRWLGSMAYQLEWQRDGELVLSYPSSGSKTALAPEQIDHILARLFCP